MVFKIASIMFGHPRNIINHWQYKNRILFTRYLQLLIINHTKVGTYLIEYRI